MKYHGKDSLSNKEELDSGDIVYTKLAEKLLTDVSDIEELTDNDTFSDVNLEKGHQNPEQKRKNQMRRKLFAEEIAKNFTEILANSGLKDKTQIKSFEAFCQHSLLQGAGGNFQTLKMKEGGLKLLNNLYMLARGGDKLLLAEDLKRTFEILHDEFQFPMRQKVYMTSKKTREDIDEVLDHDVMGEEETKEPFITSLDAQKEVGLKKVNFAQTMAEKARNIWPYWKKGKKRGRES